MKHQAFTDLAFYKGEYYLCYREAKEHMFCKSKIVVCKKIEGKWEIIGETNMIDDIRDPRFWIDGDKLKLVVNCQIIKRNWLGRKAKVAKQYILVGEIKNILPTSTYSPDWQRIHLTNTGMIGFVTFIKGNDAFCYDAVRSRYIVTKNLKTGEEKDLPVFWDSTEGSFFDQNETRIYLVRRDYNNSYWIIDNGKEMRIQPCDQKLHCPLFFRRDGKVFLLARITPSYKKAKLGMFYPFFSDGKAKLKLLDTFDDAFGDCGYFGYANNLISYYSSKDKKDWGLTGITICEINIKGAK